MNTEAKDRKEIELKQVLELSLGSPIGMLRAFPVRIKEGKKRSPSYTARILILILMRRCSFSDGQFEIGAIYARGRDLMETRLWSFRYSWDLVLPGFPF